MRPIIVGTILLLFKVGESFAEESFSLPNIPLFLKNFDKIPERLMNNPEIINWLERAKARWVTRPNATTEDLKTVWRMGVDISREVHDFVTSPDFNAVTDGVIEEIIQQVRPIIAILPPKEVTELYRMIKQNQGIFQKDNVKNFILKLNNEKFQTDFRKFLAAMFPKGDENMV